MLSGERLLQEARQPALCCHQLTETLTLRKSWCRLVRPSHNRQGHCFAATTLSRGVDPMLSSRFLSHQSDREGHHSLPTSYRGGRVWLSAQCRQFSELYSD